MELIIKKCSKCGALIQVLEDCHCSDCGIKCCGEVMEKLVTNSSDEFLEKHLPTYEIEDNLVITKINHAMDKDHYIEWIAFVYDNQITVSHFKPGDNPVASCQYTPNMKIYAYCNKHELWSCTVK